MDKNGILDLFSFFREATPDIQEDMLRCAQTTNLAEESIYLSNGDKIDVIALVGEGHLRVFKISESGREITLYGVGPGEFCLLNLLCVLTGIASPATARVEKPVQAVVFQGADFRRWIGGAPTVRTHVFALLAQSLTDTMGLVEEIAFKKMDVRLADYLQVKLQGSGAAPLIVTHEMIASDLG